MWLFLECLISNNEPHERIRAVAGGYSDPNLQENYKRRWFVDKDNDNHSSKVVYFDPFEVKDYPYKLTVFGPDCDDNNEYVQIKNSCGDCAVAPPNGKCPCKTSAADLKAMFGLTDAKASEIADVFNKYAGKFGIDTKEKLQHFLAQVKKETENLTKFTEDLDYRTTERLGVVFSKFSPKNPNKIDGTPYLNNPMKLANLVYSYRFTNGSEASGDGWRYRGRGFIHLTGKEDYIKYKNFLATVGLQNLYNQPDDLNTSPNDVLSALWYFNDRIFSKININENTTADEVTKIVNKRTDPESYDDRRKNLIIAKNEIKCN